jgi:phosphodiesterase/alkaline phosphatase D-like protein
MEWNKLKVEKEKDIAKGIINSLPEWPVFVATTPVMGFAPFEGFLQLCLWFFGALEDIFFLFEKLFRAEGIVTRKFINKCDVEYWISNRDGFGNFMNCLLHRMTISQCVFLSGDVHYSFTADTYFNSRGKQLHCWQLTSSSLCNHPNKPQRNIISRIAKNEGHASHNNQWVYNNNQRWKTEIQYISESGTENSRLTAQCNIGLVEFSEGKPFKHILFEDGQYLEFLLDSN